MVSESSEESLGEGLIVRGRAITKKMAKKGWYTSKSKFRQNNKCFNCNKERHYVRNFLDPKGKDKK